MATSLVPGIRNFRSLSSVGKVSGKSLIDHRFYRCASLCHAPKESLESLVHDYHIRLIIDLRTKEEVEAKPDPEAVLYTLKVMQIDASDALMVGDMPVDIAMGQNAKIKTCAVTYGNSPREDLEKSHPDYLIDDFCQLLELSHLH